MIIKYIKDSGTVIINGTPLKDFNSDRFISDIESFYDKESGYKTNIDGFEIVLAENDKDKLIFTIQKNLIQYYENLGLVRSVIHNLNNILTTINNNSYILLKNIEKEENKESAEYIYNASKNAVGLTRNFLRYSISKKASAVTLFNIIDVILECVNILEFRIRQYDIKIDLNTSEKSMFFRGKKGDIQQMIISVLLNSIEAFDDHKSDNNKIVISIDEKENDLIISFTDNGKGIEEHNLDDIFTEGFSTKLHGNGLGLFMCRTIINEHGGNIRIDSAYEKGTIVTITLDKENYE